MELQSVDFIPLFGSRFSSFQRLLFRMFFRSLNDNQISSITPQTFVGLDSLEEL